MTEYSYDDAVKLLTSAGKFRISLGLERIRTFLEIINNPQDKLNCIHIAGTNGKGSVCAILSSVLTSAGKKTGLFTSPHIFKYTERIQINGTPISDQDFGKYVFELTNLADKNHIDLTEFEILTAVMFQYFYDQNVDVIILETGLGGRYDATNVIKQNLCSIITHIDLDHTDKLGNTKDKIASEKAGIIKPNCPCIICEGYEAYKDKADELDSPLIMIAPFANPEKLSLKGVYQQENLSLALAALAEVFPEIPQEIIDKGLENTKHICRFQYIKDRNLIIDGAHNPNGINALKESLEFYYPTAERRFIFGCLTTKDYKKMVQNLFNEGDEIYFYKFKNPNSCDINELKQTCPYPSAEFTKATKIDFNDGKLNIICGSFYMIAELAKIIDFSCNK